MGSDGTSTAICCRPTPLSYAPVTVLRLVVGAFIFGAAALKGHQLATDGALDLPLPLSTSRWTVLALLEVEFFLGVWLVSGYAARASWRAVLAFFSLLAGLSLYLGLSGAPSCGCFGRLSINPWYVFVLDVVAVVTLWRWRPSKLPLELPQAGPTDGKPILPLRAAAPVVLLGLAPIIPFLPAVTDGLWRLEGYVVVPQPRIRHVIVSDPSSETTVSFALRNLTNEPVTIAGSKAWGGG
ncbi:MAG: hypothetical protein HY000_04430 [Planctomycetes bacterium]|nr:hypothetical protein [Planctomycetota bacterium]